MKRGEEKVTTSERERESVRERGVYACLHTHAHARTHEAQYITHTTIIARWEGEKGAARRRSLASVKGEFPLPADIATDDVLLAPGHPEVGTDGEAGSAERAIVLFSRFHELDRLF